MSNLKEHDKDAARVIDAWANIEKEQQLATVLINWSKSKQVELTSDLQELILAFFETEGANNARTEEDKCDRRRIVNQKLIINCIHSLNKEEIKKLEEALSLLIQKHT